MGAGVQFENIDWNAFWIGVQRFFAVKGEFDFWDLINSPFVVTVLVGFLGLVLQRRIRRDIETTPQVQKTIQANLEKVAQTQAQIDPLIAASQEAGANVEDHRQQATEIVQRIKDKINAAI